MKSTLLISLAAALLLSGPALATVATDESCALGLIERDSFATCDGDRLAVRPDPEPAAAIDPCIDFSGHYRNERPDPCVDASA